MLILLDLISLLEYDFGLNNLKVLLFPIKKLDLN
jgi:hypothetical protein